MGNKAQLVAIPTTSGTGSEVTSFAVISDKKNNMKYPLADYELTPNIAIIDPQFVMSLPKSATADTGLDVLQHALEAYVSVMASGLHRRSCNESYSACIQVSSESIQERCWRTQRQEKKCTMQVVWQVWHLQTHSWD